MTQKLTEKQLELVAAYEELRMAYHRSNNKQVCVTLNKQMLEIEQQLKDEGINIHQFKNK